MSNRKRKLAHPLTVYKAWKKEALLNILGWMRSGKREGLSSVKCERGNYETIQELMMEWQTKTLGNCDVENGGIVIL